MTQQEFVLGHWVERLAARLDALVSDEWKVEYALSGLQRQGEEVLGLSGSTNSYTTENIRERIARSHLEYRPSRLMKNGGLGYRERAGAGIETSVGRRFGVSGAPGGP